MKNLKVSVRLLSLSNILKAHALRNSENFLIFSLSLTSHSPLAAVELTFTGWPGVEPFRWYRETSVDSLIVSLEAVRAYYQKL